jgi:hypothetical protein
MADNTAGEQPTGLPAHLRDDLKFKPGQSGNPNGRPKGARNKLSEAFLEALLKDFEEESEENRSLGAKAIALMRSEKPHEYARMIASILAKEVDASVNGDISPELKRWLGIG